MAGDESGRENGWGHARAAAGFFVAFLCWALVPAGPAAARAKPEIWLAPLHPNDRPGGLGAADYFELFSPAAQWQGVALHVSVFQIYLDLIKRASDEQLSQLLEGLAERRMALAVEMPVLVDTAWCEPGKKGAQWMVPLIGRLKRLGADLRYVTMVGPLVDGHTYTKDHYCHRPIREVALDAARTIRAVREFYPDVTVGETEPVGRGGNFPDWSELGQWLAAFKEASGESIAFLHLDVTWGLPWQPDLMEVARESRAAGVKFGVIYDGDGTELSSQAAARSIAEHQRSVEGLPGLPLDQVIFQTWFSFPDHVLPEKDPNSMTGIVLQYLRLPAKLNLVGKRRAQLLGSDGVPIDGAEVSLEGHEPSGGDSLVAETLEGMVPTGAKAALFAVRIHTECTCRDEPAAIGLGDFSYAEGASAGPSAFRWRPESWASDRATDGETRPPGASRTVSLAAQAGQRISLNSPRFTASPGAHFDARFSWNVDGRSENTGFVAIIFFGSDGREIHRVPRQFRETYRRLVVLHSDVGGMVEVPPELKFSAIDTRLVFSGDERHGAAETPVEIDSD